MYQFKKSLKHDAYFRMAIIYSIIALIIEIYFWIQIPDLIYWIWPLVVIVICVILFLYRLSMFHHFMNDVVFVKAQVLKTHYYRGSKVVLFEYTHLGEMFRKRALINYNKANDYIQKGANIEIAIHPNKPKQALIYELYYEGVNHERPE
ncbi:MAG: hypothetical protein JXL85_02295 [Bacilli bacterium]|nr:hypothetical protein [Bacilli bacterium]